MDDVWLQEVLSVRILDVQESLFQLLLRIGIYHFLLIYFFLVSFFRVIPFHFYITLIILLAFLWPLLFGFWLSFLFLKVVCESFHIIDLSAFLKLWLWISGDSAQWVHLSLIGNDTLSHIRTLFAHYTHWMAILWGSVDFARPLLRVVSYIP